MFLHILNHEKNDHSAFKFNSHWLVKEDLVTLLKNSWCAYDDNLGVSPTVHFAANLKRIKDVSICWSIKKKVQELKDLVDIEILLDEACNKVGFGFSFEENKASLVLLESRKTKNLLDRENEARQKSRATWLLCGDDNTPFFHKFSNHRKFVNSIWNIVDNGGNIVEGFESIVGDGVHHFESLFQEDKKNSSP